MILLNFSHPLSAEQLESIRSLSGEDIEQQIDFAVHFDNDQPFLPQLQELVGKIPLTAQEMQLKRILVNPPSLNYITALLLAELHGRMGYFPPILRLRPVANSLPPRYEVAEILNLQAVRDTARKQRYGETP